MNQHKYKNRILCLTAMTGFLLTGCASGQQPAPPTEPAPTPTQSEASESTEAQTPPTVSSTENDTANSTVPQTTPDLEQAQTTALNHAGLSAADVTITKAQQEIDDGQSVYEIEFVTADTKYEYEIDAKLGTVFKYSQEAISQTSGQAFPQSQISEEEAKTAALNYANLSPDQATCTKLELDYDDGVAEYEIEYIADGIEYDFKVNASNGEILEMEMDRR